MSADEHALPDIREPRPRRVVLVGLVVLVVAAIVVVTGLRGRARSEQELGVWTRDQAIPTVAILQPQRGAPAQDIVLPGDVQAFATAPIYARASGYVKAWYKDIGARVKRGDVLADIDTPDLDQQFMQAKADLANADANAKLATVTAKRYHTLVGQAIVSQQTDDEKQGDATAKQAALDSARANVQRLAALVAFKSLVAPFDGIVTSRSVDVGALLNSGGTTGIALFQISDIHEVRVYVRVPQAFVADLAPGLKASLDVPQYPGQTFDATLTNMSNAIAAESRTALVQLQAENPDGKLWPGTFTEVHFHLPARADAMRIPATALMFGERGLRVATVDSDDRLAMKVVQIGRDIGNEVEILSGLSPGERVVDAPLETHGARRQGSRHRRRWWGRRRLGEIGTGRRHSSRRTHKNRRMDPAFFARPALLVAPELIGCDFVVAGCGGNDRRDRSLRHDRSGVAQLQGADAAQPKHVRAERPRLCLSFLWASLVCQSRLRVGQRRAAARACAV